ncbi:MAG: aminotransferase class III-fold pyridoxal phosphate-dependent enzyme, partial [Bacteroidetes bacterium]|nr:aminotransferase class III-fold pyridoxal phosphate-dependent enzyme [Bacteroidota bacterium]
SNSIINPLQEELAEKLGELSGYTSYHLFLCNSGAEANENALKLASFFNQRKKMIVATNAFHGRTGGVVNFTNNPKIIAPFNQTENVVYVALNDMDSLANQMDETVCAIILEGIQGIAGIYEMELEFLERARVLCDKTGALLILDEIQSGYGRSGKFFAHQYHHVKADLITIAKGMGNGFPIGGVLIHPKMEPTLGLLGTTFGGNHLACTAGIAVLDILKKEHLIENAARLGEILMTHIKQISSVKSVRGKGLMIGVEFDYHVVDLRNRLVSDHSIFTGNAANPNTLRLLPPLCITSQQVDYFLEKLESAVVNLNLA